MGEILLKSYLVEKIFSIFFTDFRFCFAALWHSHTGWNHWYKAFIWWKHSLIQKGMWFYTKTIGSFTAYHKCSKILCLAAGFLKAFCHGQNAAVWERKHILGMIMACFKHHKSMKIGFMILSLKGAAGTAA